MIRENPASRGTETSAEVLVDPPGVAEGRRRALARCFSRLASSAGPDSVTDPITDPTLASDVGHVSPQAVCQMELIQCELTCSGREAATDRAAELLPTSAAELPTERRRLRAVGGLLPCRRGCASEVLRLQNLCHWLQQA